MLLHGAKEKERSRWSESEHIGNIAMGRKSNMKHPQDNFVSCMTMMLDSRISQAGYTKLIFVQPTY